MCFVTDFTYGPGARHYTQFVSQLTGRLSRDIGYRNMNADNRELAESQAEICRLFGNASRVLILWTLAEREMSVGDIASVIDASLQNTSQHLRLMKDKGILSSRREGSMVYYRIKHHHLMDGCRLLVMGQQPSLAEK